MSVQNVPSTEDCHFTITPTWSNRLIVVAVPGQMLDAAASAVPPTLTGFTVIFAAFELVLVQPPLCTTARNHVSAVSGPIVAPLRVVLLFAILIGAVKSASLDFCHLRTVPTSPSN